MLIVCSPTSSSASCFDNFLFSWLLFSLRSHSITRAHQGSITVQPKTKNPSVTSWHKRCKAIAKGDEKRQRIPCNLWLQPWNGSRHLETGNPHFALLATSCSSRLYWIKPEGATRSTIFTMWNMHWLSHSRDIFTSRKFTRYSSSAPTMRMLLTASVYRPLEPPLQSVKMQFTSSVWNMNWCRRGKQQRRSKQALITIVAGHM